MGEIKNSKIDFLNIKNEDEGITTDLKCMKKLWEDL